MGKSQFAAAFPMVVIVIDLPGDRRVIQSVDLWYSKDKWTRRPKVALYGLQ
jgi:hypothetical protein